MYFLFYSFFSFLFFWSVISHWIFSLLLLLFIALLFNIKLVVHIKQNERKKNPKICLWWLSLFCLLVAYRRIETLSKFFICHLSDLIIIFYIHTYLYSISDAKTAHTANTVLIKDGWPYLIIQGKKKNEMKWNWMKMGLTCGDCSIC